MDTALTRSQFVRWRIAIFAIFLASGLSIATWASRVPSIAAALQIDKAQIGLLLLGMGIASIIGISTGPLVMARTGARLGMLIGMLMFGSGVILIGLGTDVLGSVPVVIAGLVLFGFGNGSVDVMMNVEATAIEQQMGRTILPVFHAFFSFGTVIGAGAGMLASMLHPNVAAHTMIISALIYVAAVACFFQVPVREAALEGVRDELPHSIAVVVEEVVETDPGGDPFAEVAPGEGRLVVRATLFVERDSQKGIIIGRGGSRLREVGSRARAEINALLGRKVHLDLRIKVAKDWQRDPKQLGRLGF